MENLIQPMEVTRDADGWWSHPAIPEFDEDYSAWKAWLVAQGLETQHAQLEDEDESHPSYIAYFENGEASVAEWHKDLPSGDGWFVLSIHDTEDGPTWVWARRIA